MHATLKSLVLYFLGLAGLLISITSQALDLSPRIVGGDPINISNAPATVALLSRAGVETDGELANAQFCGGTVISARWVLTAAHCVVSPQGQTTSNSAIMVLMGTTDLNNPVNQPVGVDQIFVHESYSTADQGNDIALLRLEFDSLVAPTPINTTAVELNEVAYIAGWGALNEGGGGVEQEFPGTLRGAFVRMVPGEVCGDYVTEYQGFTDVSNICAGTPVGGIDSCQGDSGGPMFRVTGDTLPVVSVTGITSWGIGCADASFLGVYTNVAHFTDWIVARTGDAVLPTGQTPVDDSPVADGSGATGAGATGGSAGSTPAAIVDPDDDDGFLGSSGGLFLGILGLVFAMRKRRIACTNASTDLINVCHAPKTSKFSRHALLMVVASASLLITQGVQPLQAADDANPQELSLLELAIGEGRETVMADAQSFYGSEASCATVRTGFGKTRRAYFLETCTLTNTAEHTLYDSTPSLVEFRFLENELVQVAYVFDEITDPDKFRRCIEKHNDELALKTDSKHVIEADEQFRTTVSNLESVEQIHLMRKNL
ncbi:MAG: serine protease [Granulosicoccus sp.]|nr:serine protease [Granulosicoccus sp.]